jgi:hypothetical protein
MYQKTEIQGKKKSVYTMWVKQSDQITPVRYEMMGYDSLLGSHFDKYYVDYINFSNTPVIPQFSMAMYDKIFIFFLFFQCIKLRIHYKKKLLTKRKLKLQTVFHDLTV